MDIDELYYQAVDLLKELIATPSISREENNAADIIERFFSNNGATPHRHGNNVWCLANDFNESLPTLLLNSHIDTVKPASGWTRDPFSPDVDEEGKLYGLGSNDDGASLVTLLQVFYKICQKPQRYNTIFLASAEEEVSGANGIEAVLPLLPPISCAIMGEPTSMQPAIAEKGLMVLDCVAEGVSGHAARNEGVNAIYKAMADIEWFRNHNCSRTSELLGDVKMTVTQIEAGTQHNVIPDKCSFIVDVRSNECYSNKELLELIKSSVSSNVTARSTRLNSSAISVGHPLVKRALELGRKPYGSPTLSNQSLVRDIPTLKMGPGDTTRSHTANEFVLISEIRDGIEKFCALLDGLKL